MKKILIVVALAFLLASAAPGFEPQGGLRATESLILAAEPQDGDRMSFVVQATAPRRGPYVVELHYWTPVMVDPPPHFADFELRTGEEITSRCRQFVYQADWRYVDCIVRLRTTHDGLLAFDLVGLVAVEDIALGVTMLSGGVVVGDALVVTTETP